MMIGQITNRQATALAKFIHELRSEWDVPGITDALWQARGFAPVAELAQAAIRAASEPANRTPKIIALNGPHWRGSEATPKIPEPDAGLRCSVCSEPKHRCRARWADDHEFVSVADVRGRKAARSALADARQQTTNAPTEETA